MNLLGTHSKIEECDDFRIITLPTKINKQGHFTEYRVINKSKRYSTQEIIKSCLEVIKENIIML